MIKPTDEMAIAANRVHKAGKSWNEIVAAVLAIVERDRAEVEDARCCPECDGPSTAAPSASGELYAIVWHAPTEPHPDGRHTRITTDRAEAIEDANYYTQRSEREGAGDHQYVAYRLVPLYDAAVVQPGTQDGPK